MERDIICTHNILYAIISTHTLTWSVTVCAFAIIIDLLNFNSHAHVERDRSGFVRVNLYALSFQLTRSRGA